MGMRLAGFNPLYENSPIHVCIKGQRIALLAQVYTTKEPARVSSGQAQSDFYS